MDFGLGPWDYKWQLAHKVLPAQSSRLFFDSFPSLSNCKLCTLNLNNCYSYSQQTKMKSSWVIHLVHTKKITVEMDNCYFGENKKNKKILFLTSLVHLFSHFELIILALKPRSVFPAKMYSLCAWIAQNSVFNIKRIPLFHPKYYKTSVCILLLSLRSLKTSFGFLWLIWGFSLHPTPPLFCTYSQKWMFQESAHAMNTFW